MSSSLIRATALVAFALICAGANGQVQPLNDTGIIVCRSPDAPCDPIAHKKQDAMVGRDAARRTPGSGLTTNTTKGFSYTKVSRAGAVLADDALLGDQPGDWACTRDNVTGLLWEVKTDSPTNFRWRQNVYSWYEPDIAKNGGNAGVENGGNCNVSGRCDTQKYVQDVNAVALCGRNNWRLPTVREVQGMFDLGSPSFRNESFFPFVGTISGAYCGNQQVVWTATTSAKNSAWVWMTNFGSASVELWPKNNDSNCGPHKATVWAVSTAP